ncbi:MAG: hypothetical protein MEQ84_01105 [Mesorhizobium sp.]|nr:hypothetical protein [Mesorhizobium sp.]
MEFAVILILKFLHLVGLMLGAAAGFGSMAVIMQARKAGGPPPAPLMALRPFFGKLGLAGILLLWVTGLALWGLRYEFAHLGAAYVLKLVAATALLGMILFMSRATARMARDGTPPPAWMPKLGMMSSPLTFLAVFLAVWVFA